MGRPRLLLENAQAWEAWARLRGQFDFVDHQEKDGDQFFIYRRPTRFRHESAWAVVTAMEPDDPLELFDKVSLISSVYIQTWTPSGG